MVLDDAATPRGLNEADKAMMLEEVRRTLWRWFFNHQNDVVIRRKIILFSVTIYVHTLRPLFEQLLGAPPTDALRV